MHYVRRGEKGFRLHPAEDAERLGGEEVTRVESVPVTGEEMLPRSPLTPLRRRLDPRFGQDGGRSRARPGHKAPKSIWSLGVSPPIISLGIPNIKLRMSTTLRGSRPSEVAPSHHMTGQ